MALRKRREPELEGAEVEILRFITNETIRGTAYVRCLDRKSERPDRDGLDILKRNCAYKDSANVS